MEGIVMTFLWWHVLISLSWATERPRGGREVSVSGKRSVKSSLSSRDKNWSGQLPMSECPSTQEMAKRHTHSCLLALAWLTVSPPSESHRHASAVSVSGRRWYFTTGWWYQNAAQLISWKLYFWGGRCKRITTGRIGSDYFESQTHGTSICLCSTYSVQFNSVQFRNTLLIPKGKLNCCSNW